MLNLKKYKKMKILDVLFGIYKKLYENNLYIISNNQLPL